MPSIREGLEAAAEQETEPTPADDTPLEAEPSDPGQDTPPEQPEEKEPAKTEQTEKPTDDKGRVRGPDGKFAPKTKEPEGVQPGPKVGEPPPQPQQIQPKAEALKAPQSWKPELREKWASVPREFQEEMVRRDRETAVALNESAEARRFHNTINQSLAPLQGVIAAHGVSPDKYLADVTQQLAVLNFGTMDQKAHIAAALIASHGIDQDALVDAYFKIKGRPAEGSNGQPRPAPPVDPEAIVRQAEQRVLARMQAQGQESAIQRSMGEIRQYLETKKPEFWSDVQNELRLVFADAEQRGQPVEIDSAYQTACMLSPSVRSVLQQREQAAAQVKQAETARAATQRAKAAGVSVKSTPAGSINGTSSKKSLGEQLRAAAADLGGQ